MAIDVTNANVNSHLHIPEKNGLKALMIFYDSVIQLNDLCTVKNVN